MPDIDSLFDSFVVSRDNLDGSWYASIFLYPRGFEMS